MNYIENSYKLPSIDNIDWEYIKGLTLEDYYMRMYKAQVNSNTVYKQVSTERDLLGIATDNVDVIYFVDEIDEEFDSLEDLLRVIKKLEGGK